MKVSIQVRTGGHSAGSRYRDAGGKPSSELRRGPLSQPEEEGGETGRARGFLEEVALSQVPKPTWWPPGWQPLTPGSAPFPDKPTVRGSPSQSALPLAPPSWSGTHTCGKSGEGQRLALSLSVSRGPWRVLALEQSVGGLPWGPHRLGVNEACAQKPFAPMDTWPGQCFARNVFLRNLSAVLRQVFVSGEGAS